jgi:ABC-type sugar transport system permease subunit
MSFLESKQQRAEDQYQFAAGKRRRAIQEALTGYLFVLPAALATFLFGLWPVIAGFYESLKSGSPLTNRYVGLDNYIRSLGSLTYILLYAICLAFLFIGYQAWRAIYLHQRERGGTLWLYVVPGLVAGLGLIVLAFIYVTGLDGYGWVYAILLLLALAGFVTGDHMQRPRAEWDLVEVGKSWLLLLAF